MVLSVDLRGQVALVTGASTGLGRRFARVLARAGAKVVVAARRAELLDQVVSEIRGDGGKAESLILDLADATALPGAVDLASSHFGPITILVNNAGLGISSLAINQPIEELDALFAVNVRAPYVLAREVAKRLIDAGQPGRIVNVSSIAAFAYDKDTPPSTFYAVTKAGIRRMTEVLAIEWASHNINVTGIAPGVFRTDMLENLEPEQVAAIERETIRNRLGRPDQLDSTLLYLVSPASDFLTGVTIVVDDAQSGR